MAFIFPQLTSHIALRNMPYPFPLPFPQPFLACGRSSAQVLSLTSMLSPVLSGTQPGFILSHASTSPAHPALLANFRMVSSAPTSLPRPALSANSRTSTSQISYFLLLLLTSWSTI